MKKRDFIKALAGAALNVDIDNVEYTTPYPGVTRVNTYGTVLDVYCDETSRGTYSVKFKTCKGMFDKHDVKRIEEFLDKNGIDYKAVKIYTPTGGWGCNYTSGLTIRGLDDLPWHHLDEIELVREEPCCNTCKVVLKLQAENQRLKYELDEARAEIAKLKGQVNRKADRHGKPWCRAFEFPGGIGFGFGF